MDNLIISLLGTGAVTTFIGYLLGGKLKIKTDAITSMQIAYDRFLLNFNLQMELALAEIKELKTQNTNLQEQFNKINLSYATAVEGRDKYQAMYNDFKKENEQIKKDHDLLKIDYDNLKTDHDKLKKEFENYKKNNKWL